MIAGPDSLYYFESDSAGYGLELVRVARSTPDGDLAGQTTYRRLGDGAECRGQALKCLWKWRLCHLNISTTTVMVSGPCGLELWIVRSTRCCTALFHTLPYDSWVTIGIEQAPNTALGEAEVQGVSSPGQNWLAAFSAGGGIDINDDVTGGAWFVTNDASNGIAGEDQAVLVAQFTTDGVVSGTLNFQLFLEWRCRCGHPTHGVFLLGGDGVEPALLCAVAPRKERRTTIPMRCMTTVQCASGPGCTYADCGQL